MEVEVGKIVEGRVTGITNFGAFIQLLTGEPDWFIFPKWHLITLRIFVTTLKLTML